MRQAWLEWTRGFAFRVVESVHSRPRGAMAVSFAVAVVVVVLVEFAGLSFVWLLPAAAFAPLIGVLYAVILGGIGGISTRQPTEPVAAGSGSGATVAESVAESVGSQ